MRDERNGNLSRGATELRERILVSSTVPSVVDVPWLLAHRGDPGVRVVDVRWSLAAPGRDAYAKGHVAGAAFVDLDTELSAATGPGRHPIPSAARVAEVFGALGVGPETHVVAYDDAAGSVAARAWFLLRGYGHDRVSILDGGFPAWVAAGGPVSTDVPTFLPRALALREALPEGEVVDKPHVRSLSDRRDASVRLIDVRARPRYLGETEPVDARPGHIPGAKSVPWSENVVTSPGDAAPHLRSAAELRALYTRALGDAREVVFYCGSGVTASLAVLAFERADLPGVRARLYEGSYSDWARDPSLPVAHGDE